MAQRRITAILLPFNGIRTYTLQAASNTSNVSSNTPSSQLSPKFRPRKAAMTLTPRAVERLKLLFNGPNPQMIRVGVRNKGCAGMSYHLEYVDKKAKFDEQVEQDGVKVLIDSKALFSIIGSEMDYVQDRLSSKFIFHNPNVKEQCGCGESFATSQK